MSIIKNLLSQQMLALILKEFREVWRDRRALMIAVGFALLFPVIMIGAGALSLKVISESTADVALIGADHAPLLEEYLQGGDLQLIGWTMVRHVSCLKVNMILS